MDDEAVGQFVTSLFRSDGREKSLESAVSADIDRCSSTGAVSSHIDFDALSAQFRATEIPQGSLEIAGYFRELGGRVVAHAINTSSPNYMGHMTSGRPYCVRPLSQLVTALNQNVVK